MVSLNGERERLFWIITEANRLVATVLLPEATAPTRLATEAMSNAAQPPPKMAK
jgi:hypothetical protein